MLSYRKKKEAREREKKIFQKFLRLRILPLGLCRYAPIFSGITGINSYFLSINVTGKKEMSDYLVQFPISRLKSQFFFLPNNTNFQTHVSTFKYFGGHLIIIERSRKLLAKYPLYVKLEQEIISLATDDFSFATSKCDLINV